MLGGEEPVDAAELTGLLPAARLSEPRADADASPGPVIEPLIGPVIEDLSLWEQEHALLVHALERTNGNQTRAAHLLKVSREQLRTRMRRYGLLPKP